MTSPTRPRPPRPLPRSRAPLATASLGTVLASLALAACAGGTSGGGTGGTPVQGGTITYAHVQEPPCIFGGWIQQAYISRQVLDGLVTEDEDGSVKPWLATSWKTSPDGLTYTFTLKDGVKFTDGTPLDAEAVAYNFEQFEHSDLNGTAKVSIDPYYKKAEAVDATHVAIHLHKPYPEFLRLITQGYFGIQSAHALKTRTKEQNCERPIGSGAFTVEKWNKGQNVLFRKNPGYTSWPATAKHKGPAYVDTIDWKFVADGTSRYASLTTGQSDVIYEVPTVNWKDARARFRNTIRYITPGHPVSFYLNTQQGPFTDKLVRQAFARAADREAAVDAGFHGVIPYEPNPSVSQSTPGYLDTDPYPYDPAEAAQLLKRAGWSRGAGGIYAKDGRKLRVRLVYGPGYQFTSEGATVLQALQEQWRQNGFDVTLVPATQAESWGGTYSTPDSYDTQASYWTSPSPAILWIIWRESTKDNPNGNNHSFYNDSSLTRLIDRANTNTDTAAGFGQYKQAQKVVNDEAAGVGLYTQNTLIAVSDKLHGFWVEKSQGEPVFSDAYFTGKR
ncbi:ABC transporter substrate-binding protein [Streptomyces sp. P6-2-1]|uniref:ABC transporter substrate-binding protein n=1 Tax=Streptomyces sp. P6-2-1 TaxID=3422591 RepID=UPI003D35A3EF